MRYEATILILAALALSACPSGDDDDNDANVCGEDLTRGQVYVEGLEARTDDTATLVMLMAADPAPPNVDTNVWEIEVVNLDGDALTGCTAEVTPWMPDHGHGSSDTPSWTESSETAGSYTTELKFIMPGYWETTFTLDCDGAVSEHVFGFCAEG